MNQLYSITRFTVSFHSRPTSLLVLMNNAIHTEYEVNFTQQTTVYYYY